MLANTKYTRRLSRLYPGLFVIMLDQSGSMGEQVLNYNCSKADFATTALNTIIYEMIEAAGFEEYEQVRKKYAYLSILGYSDTVYPLLSSSDEPVDIPTLGDNPKGTAPIVRNIKTASGTFRRITETRPFWIEPRASGNTQMAQAFMRAREVVRHWLQSRPESGQAERKYSFPPIIINITDAQHNGSGDPVNVAQEIQSHGTEEGNILIFNCHFTKEMNQPCIFPNHTSQVSHLDSQGLALKMFQMSSIIPEILRNDAGKMLLSQKI